MPDFIRGTKEIKGTDELTQFVKPPFVKIVQGASDSETKEKFGEGSVILAPGNDLIIDKDGIMIVTPIFFYRQFLVVNPLELRGQVPMIADSSFDPKSDIARRAMDADLRNEPMKNADGSPMMIKGKPIYKSYQDVRTYLSLIQAPVQPGIVVAFTFSRGELRTGDRLATLISARQKSLYLCQFEFRVGIHRDKAGTNDWNGFDIDNPSNASPWVASAEIAAEYERMHDLFELAFKEKKSQFDVAAAVVGGGDVPSEPIVQDPTVKEGDTF